MRPASFALLPLALLAVQGTPSPTATFASGSVEARGVCDVRPDGLACWDMAGKPSSALESVLRSALAGNGGDVSFRLGRKNRHLVVRRTATLPLSYTVEGQTNGYVYPGLTSPGDPQTDFLRVSVDPGDAAASLRIQAIVPAKSEVDVPLVEGTRARVDGWSVEVGAVRKLGEKKGAEIPPRRPAPYGGGLPTGVAQWTVVLGATGRDGESASWRYTPLDKAGAPIRYVDAQGTPIRAVRALELEPSLQPQNGNPFPVPAPGERPRAMGAVFLPDGFGAAFRAVTNVDPRLVSAVRIAASHSESALVGPFPLDPR